MFMKKKIFFTDIIKRKALLFLMFTMLSVPLCAQGASINVSPSSSHVELGDDFFVDIVVDGIPSTGERIGLGTVQFRLNVSVDGISNVRGVYALNNDASSEVLVATPLLMSAPTAVNSGLGDMFLSGQGSEGILVMDNDNLVDGSALYTYAHTNGATHSTGSGTIARFAFHVGSLVEGSAINVSLSDVVLIDGGLPYDLTSNTGATISIGCLKIAPTLVGLAEEDAIATLTNLGLSVGTITEIPNDGSLELNKVLGQSVSQGTQLYCGDTVDLVINKAPNDITNLSYTDKVGDDSGTVILSWNQSLSSDVSGYKIYVDGNLYATIDSVDITSIEVTGLANNNVAVIKVVAFDDYNNDSSGLEIEVTPVDDVQPVVTIAGIQDGSYYNLPVTPEINVTDSDLLNYESTLNGEVYNGEAIVEDGNYELTVTAIDNSGNVEAVTYTFTIDTAAPSIVVSGVEEGLYYNYDLSPVISVTDINLDSFEVTLNGVVYSEGPITEEGYYILTVSAIDRALNETSYEIKFAIDKTSPDSDAQLTSIVLGSDQTLYITPESLLVISSSDESSLASSGVNRIEYKIDDNDWVTYENSNVSLYDLSEGSYNLYFRAVDNSGNIESASNLSFVIDKTAPSSIISDSGPSLVANDVLYVAGANEFTITATDNASGVSLVEYRIDSGQWVTYEQFNLPSGNHLVEYRSVDEVGNVETVNNLSVFVDVVSAKSTIVVGSPNATVEGVTYVTESTEFTITSTDSASGVALVDYRVDSGDWTTYEPFTLSGDGTHKIEYRSSDNVGNSGVVDEINVYIDIASPTTEINVGSPNVTVEGVTYVTESTELTITATDDASGVALVEYRVDGGDWTVYSTITLSGEGEHLIEYRSTDSVGNAEASNTLSVFVDKSNPVTNITVGTPSYNNGTLYVTDTTEFTLTATDSGSGVDLVEYRIDGGEWTAYTPFTLSGHGIHTIEYRSTDAVGNIETFNNMTVSVDTKAPITTLSVGDPTYKDIDGNVYITESTSFKLNAVDYGAGLSSTIYRIDGGQWSSNASFTLSGEGIHTIEYKSSDYLGNSESIKSLEVTVDIATPESEFSSDGTSYTSGSTVYVNYEDTTIAFNATDNLSGVGATYYQIDDDTEWYEFVGNIGLQFLSIGEHTIKYHSVDNLGNTEQPKSVVITLVDIDVDVSIENVPRVLFWTADPKNGSKDVAYKIEDIQAYLDYIFYGQDVYYTVVSEKDEFKNLFRSGMYNVAAIISQDTPINTTFARELKEAVNNGMGLIVSGWGNSVPHHLSEVLGVKFIGSKSMDTNHKSIDIYEGNLSDVGQSIITSGRVIKTELTTGSLEGVVTGDYECNGVKDISLNIPLKIAVGDFVEVKVYAGKNGKKFVDVENYNVSTLPVAAVDMSSGSIYGNAVITQISSDNVSISLNPYADTDLLEQKYFVQVINYHVDGTESDTGIVEILTDCSSNLRIGTQFDSFTVAGVNIDYTNNAFGVVPGAVSNDYGNGKTVFLPFDLIYSAHYGSSSEFGNILLNAVRSTIKEESDYRAGGVYLIKTSVTSNGGDFNVLAEDVLDPAIKYLPIFELSHNNLIFELSLLDGVSSTYSYFIEVPELVGTYYKETSLSLQVDSGYVPWSSYLRELNISSDLESNYEFIESELSNFAMLYPQYENQIGEILSDFSIIRNSDLITSDEIEKVIHDVIKMVHSLINLNDVNVLSVRSALDECLYILGVKYYNSLN